VVLPDSIADVAARNTSGDFLLLARLKNLQTPVDGVLGALPRLIDRAGDSVVVDPVRFAAEEGIRANFVTDLHPRTAAGYDEDLNWLYLVVVDGRSDSAAGMDLIRLAHLFRKWGCDLALNFDGGGSTTMVVEGETVNSPSDPSGERPVSNSLLLRER
jgi:exopolysaccharide biosynthesis protein